MNYHKISMFGTMMCLLGLGFSDTASGQITTSPSLSSGMSFNVQSGGAQASQNLTIYTPQATTVFISVPSGQTWLKVNGEPGSAMFTVNTSQNGASASATVPVQVNTLNLSTNQFLSANLVLMIANEPATQVNFPVNLQVGTQSALSANPANISFSAVTGSSFGSPSSIPVTISSNTQALNYNLTATTTTGGNWLLLTNTQNIPTNNSSPGFSVSVNASALAVGTYNGVISVQSTTTGDSTTIPVTLTVNAGAALNVTPTTLSNFIFQAGSSSVTSQTQNLMISTSSGSLNYQILATATMGSSTNWLVVTPNGGLATTTPQTVQLSLSYLGVASLPVGTYQINLAISPTASSGNTTNIPVTLVVSNNPILTVNNNNLSFSIPFGTTTTQQQTVQLTSSSGASIPYTVQTNSSPQWLTTSVTSGNTSSNSVLAIYANASNLAVQSTPYLGTVTIYPANGDNYSITINVQLTVTAATTTLYAAPATLLFSYETSQVPPGLQVVSLSGPPNTGFSVSTSTTPGSNCPTNNWLIANPSQNVIPASLTVSVLTTGMSSGFCSGQVLVNYNNGSQNTSTTINVFVDIATTSLLTVTPDPDFGMVTASVGTNSVLSSRILLGSTDGSALGYSAFASTPNSPGNVAWLSLGNSQGNTQQYLEVYVLPSGLPIGVYTGTVTINATNSANLPSGQLVIPVVLTITANTTIALSPPSLTFTETQGATTAPKSQNVNIVASGGTSQYTLSVNPVTGGNWLQVTPTSGTASGTITASVAQNSLSVGTYTSNIVLQFLSATPSTLTIPVSLTVTAAQTVTVSASTLNFSYQLGAATPATQTINVTSTGSTSVPVTVTSTSTPAWLTVTPSSGSAGPSGSPLVLTASVVPSALTAAGTFNGTITITPQGQSPVTVAVTLTVTGSPAPQLVSISNAASGGFGVIAPGELITIKGTNLGPATPATFTIGGGGTLSSTLSGVQVMFDTIAGTPIYVSASQINVIVPYEIAGRATTNVTVLYGGQVSAGIPQNVANQAPGIFTDSSTGVGQASVLNANGALNGPSTGLVINGTNISTTPAAEGSGIAVFMTGGGQTSPLSTTGTITPTGPGTVLYNLPAGSVKATIGGVNAPVQFAGAAPGEVTGVIQVNLTVPTGVSGSALQLVITINGVASPAGTTVAVQ